MTTVSAQVVLHSPTGALRDHEVTAENIDRLAPAEDVVQRVRQALAEAGFEVGPAVGISFSISAEASRFERYFATPLRHHAGSTRWFAGDDDERLELPREALPAEIREAVRTVAFTPPPDFGPGGGFG